MKKDSNTKYLAPQIAQQEFRVEEGVAASATGASVGDLSEVDTYSDDGEWS